ncbi:MAG: TyeA family type III secretion system gatekeeper subunit [Endozoicomonas sp.]
MASGVGGIQQFTAPSLESAVASQAAGAKSGKMAGEQVKVSVNTSSPLAKAADIAEEISQAKSQFKNDLKDRKLSKGDSRAQKILDKIRKIQTIEKLQGIDEFKGKFGTSANLNRKNLRDEAQKFSDDVFHQFVALHEAAAEYEAENGPGSASEFYGAIDDLRAEGKNDQAIKIGLNLTEEAGKQSVETRLFSISEARKEYFDHVRDHKSLESTYDDLNSRHGVDNFETAVKVQLKLLATDLGCLDPSTPPERLQAIIQDLSKLKVLVGLHDGCIETEEQIQRIYPDMGVKEQVLMKKMLNLLEKQWITENDFERIPDEINVTELEPQIFTMTKVVDLVRMLPEEIFSNLDTKLNMQSAASDTLDNLIMQESGEDAEMVEDDSYGVLGDGLLGEITTSLGSDFKGGGEADSLVPTLGASQKNSNTQNEAPPSGTSDSSQN